MKKIETKIPGLFIIEPDVHGDHRGYFMETYNQAKFQALGIDNVFVQDNMSFSAAKGTFAGNPFPERTDGPGQTGQLHPRKSD